MPAHFACPPRRGCDASNQAFALSGFIFYFRRVAGNGTGVSAGEIASFPQSSPPPFASDGLRRRAARVDTPDDADNDDSHPLSVLKRLDAFPKARGLRNGNAACAPATARSTMRTGSRHPPCSI